MQTLLTTPYVIYFLSFWLLLEYQQVGKLIAGGNPFESAPALLSLPQSIKNLTILLSNMFIGYLSFIIPLIACFFADAWYLPALLLVISWIGSYILFSTSILKSIIGFRGIVFIGPLWLVGMAYFLISVISG